MELLEPTEQAAEEKKELFDEQQKKNREEMIQKIEMIMVIRSFSVSIRNTGIIQMVFGAILVCFGWLMKETALIFGGILIVMGALSYEKERKFLEEIKKKYGV